MDIVTIRNLTKTYPGFMLDKASFSLAAGRIAGFIGRNDAGKTTVIKCMLNLQICKDNGWSSETAYGIYAAMITAKGTPDDLEGLGEIKTSSNRSTGSKKSKTG